mmetsp:Transcript_93752/g.244237  ORF Transcript_93752/g.244237 Transcript_93752/m.244237 type:complete len:233 (-) Transcript_93752:260-958(-)
MAVRGHMLAVNHMVAIPREPPKPISTLGQQSSSPQHGLARGAASLQAGPGSSAPGCARPVHGGSSPLSASVSTMLLRPHMAVAPGMIASRKGTLQPHTSMASGPTAELSTARKQLVKAHATWLPTDIIDTAMPTLASGEASISQLEMAPISPPTERPCRARQKTSPTRPRPLRSLPKCSPGSRPCPTVATIMPARDRFTASLRLHLSATQPRRKPPTGRATNVTAKPSQPPS